MQRRTLFNTLAALAVTAIFAGPAQGRHQRALLNQSLRLCSCVQ